VDRRTDIDEVSAIESLQLLFATMISAGLLAAIAIAGALATL
jgi:hypothetical protein